MTTAHRKQIDEWISELGRAFEENRPEPPMAPLMGLVGQLAKDFNRCADALERLATRDRQERS